MKIFSMSVYLLALLSMSLILTPIVRAEDEVEDDEDVAVNEEGGAQTAAETEADEVAAGDDQELRSSPFAKTQVLFISPESTDLPAGKVAKLLIGFKNNGSAPFIVETIDGSFRYPQDFSYHIQNFSTYHFNKVIESEREATFEYVFTPSEVFSSRQFGLTINLRYRNLDGKQFVNSVFNDTINVVEPEEGLDGETFFLYVFLGAIVILLLVGGNHLLSTFRKKSGRSSKYTAHKQTNGSGVSGTTSVDGIDYEWIPKEHLQQNKSPRQSPRQRKVKNGSGAQTSGNSSNDE